MEFAFAQMYVFEMDDETCPVWCESFDDLGHWAAPTPFFKVADAVAHLTAQHPGVYVDSLDAADAVESIAFARSAENSLFS